MLSKSSRYTTLLYCSRLKLTLEPFDRFSCIAPNTIAIEKFAIAVIDFGAIVFVPSPRSLVTIDPKRCTAAVEINCTIVFSCRVVHKTIEKQKLYRMH